MMEGPDSIFFGHHPQQSGADIWGNSSTRLMGSDVDIYVRNNTYMGIKVADDCINRMIPKDANLADVFTPVHKEYVYCFDIYPGSEDIQKYQDILQDVANGDAILESQDKHPTDKGFIIMLVVNYARMVFRKEEYKEDYPVIEVNNE